MISEINGEVRRRNSKIVDKIFGVIIEFNNKSIFFDLSNRAVVLTTFLKFFKKVCVLKCIYSYF